MKYARRSVFASGLKSSFGCEHRAGHGSGSKKRVLSLKNGLQIQAMGESSRKPAEKLHLANELQVKCGIQGKVSDGPIYWAMRFRGADGHAIPDNGWDDLHLDGQGPVTQ
jgi:hypothetical protein